MRGVLSAYGIGLANLSTTQVESVEMTLNRDVMPQLESRFNSLIEKGTKDEPDLIIKKVNLKYAGTDFDFNYRLQFQRRGDATGFCYRT